MILTVAAVADVDRFRKTFSTKGVEKRREHGGEGAWVFRDPDDPSRVWAVFAWELEDYDRFLADPEIPASAAERGVRGTPLMAAAVAQYDSWQHRAANAERDREGAAGKAPMARVFSTQHEEGAIPFGEQAIFIGPAVEKSDGRPLSAYAATFSRGERAALPAPYDEVGVVVRGRIRVGAGNHAVEAGAGDYVYGPANTPGEVLAVEETTMVCVAAPAHGSVQGQG